MNPASMKCPAALRCLLTSALVILAGAASARAQETWAPVLMFDGSSITIGGVATPIPNGPVPPGIRIDQPFNDNPDPLIAYPNGVAENRLTDEWIVADTYHSRLLRFATDHNSAYAAGTLLGVLPVPGAPYSPVIDDDGTMIVPDFYNSNLTIFVPSDTSHTPASYTRTAITSFQNGGVPDFFNQPRRVALIADPANGMHVALGIGTVVVLDSANDRVLKLTPTGGVASSSWTVTLAFGQNATIFGSGPGKFVYPTGLAVDAAGNIYVTDPNNEQLISIQVFDSTGHPLQTISQGLSSPWSVALDPTGRLFVTDSSNNRIAVFAKYDSTNPAASMAPIAVRIGSASQPLGGIVAFPVPNPAGPIGTLQEPTAMVFDQFGRAVVADTDDFRIQIFDKARLNVTALAYPQTLTATDPSVTVRVAVSIPVGDTGPINNVVPAIPTVSFEQGGIAVVTTPPSCVVMPGALTCTPLSSLTGQSLTLANQPLVYGFQFNRITTPVEATGPAWFAVNASGVDASGQPVLSGNAQTYAVAVRGDLAHPPTMSADLNDPRNGTPPAGWYMISPVYVHIQAAVPSPGTAPGQDGFVQEIEFNFGPMPPQEGDFYTCFNRFTADDPTDTSCILPVYREGITQVWYRVLSTPGLYDHLTPSTEDPTINVPGWSSKTVQLDFSPPTFAMTPVSPSNPSVVLAPNNGWFTTLPIELDFTVSDLGSYLDTVQTNADGGTSTVSSTSGTPFASGTFTYTAEGAFNPTITAFDRAGNEGVYVRTVLIDVVPPALTFTTASSATGLQTIGTTRWSRTPIAATFAATDTRSGFDATGTQTATCTVQVTSGIGQSAVCHLADYAGNVGTGTAGPFSIDSTAPTYTFTTTPVGVLVGTTRWYAAAPTSVTFTATDTQSGFTGGATTTTKTVSVLGNAASTPFTDRVGNTVTATAGPFAIDVIAPVIAVPTNITVPAAVPAAKPTTAVVTFTVTATDNVDPAPATSCLPASGSSFAFGTTTVRCTSTDVLGNAASSTFTVTVVDGTAPVLALPSPITLNASVPTAVTYTVSASDNLDAHPTVVCTPASGSIFQVTTTTVSCTATDAAGNSSTATFTVKLGAASTPVLTVPANKIVEATGTAGAVVTYTATATDSNGSVPVVCTPPSGSTFPIATMTVSCTATNTAHLTATKTFTIKVQDTTPPVITQADITSIATASTGAIVTFTPAVSDIVDGAADAVTCTPASGTRFAIATTTVTCTATDHAGNKGTKTFKVTVGHSLPVCTAAVANPKSIWPANHQIVNVGISGVTNADGAAITYTITSIFQDEPTSGLGYGDVPVDGFGVGTSQAQVRAERGSSSNGRVYHIRYTATTAAGSCSGEVTTGVPQYQGGSVVDGGALYDSTIALPNAVNDTASTLKGVATTISVLGNDSDPFGYILTVTSATGAAHGTTKVNANNTITYTPVAGFAGSDTFTYTVSNGHGGTDSATVTVTVSAHSRGDDCDHDDHRNGHRDGDGCDHDKDVHSGGHYSGDGDDHDRHRNGHYDGDGCDHDRGR